MQCVFSCFIFSIVPQKARTMKKENFNNGVLVTVIFNYKGSGSNNLIYILCVCVLTRAHADHSALNCLRNQVTTVALPTPTDQRTHLKAADSKSEEGGGLIVLDLGENIKSQAFPLSKTADSANYD